MTMQTPALIRSRQMRETERRFPSLLPEIHGKHEEEMRILSLFILLTSLPCTAQHPDNLIREDVMIPLRDGAKLGGILYRPSVPGKYPGIVYRTPYGVDDYDSYAELPPKAAKQGYAVLLVDVRSRLRSEGEFEAYRNEKQDGNDVI